MKAALAVAASAALLCLALPLIVLLGITTSSCSSTPATPFLAADGSPSILGSSTMTADQIAQWWLTTKAGPDPLTTIGVDITTLAGLYVNNGDGVRGDIAFAQAVVETGYFASSDATALDNFAGIGHPDGAASGTPFPSVQVGVTAQLQLLVEVVQGNDTPLAEAKVAPNWGGRTVATWAGLAGNWASDLDYWTKISDVYGRMLTGNGVAGPDNATLVAATCSATTATLEAAPGAVQAAIAFALAQVGKPYQWGAAGPDSFDCSGLVQAAYKAAGIAIPRTTYTQVLVGASVTQAELEPGDLVFPDPDHVQIYLGDGMVVEAPHTGAFVQVVKMWGFWQARRIVAWAPPQLVSSPSNPMPSQPVLVSAPGPVGGAGFYPGDTAEPGQVSLFFADKQRYGVLASFVVLMEDTSSPANMNGSTWGHLIGPGGWQTVPTGQRPTMVISVPLAFGAFTPDAATSADNLQAVAGGSDDGSYLYLAHALAASGYGNAIIRLGWEFDGNWMPWEATQNPGLYVAAFRHVHDLMRSVSTFRFDWTGAAGVGFDGTQAYPGDGYVDIVGEDIYDEPGTNVAAQLAPRALFAAAHGKPNSYAEWGLTSSRGDDPVFIQNMASWMASVPLAYQSYFLGLAVGSPLTNYPASMALYERLFG